MIIIIISCHHFRCSVNASSSIVFVSLEINGMPNNTNDSESGIYVIRFTNLDVSVIVEPKIGNNNTVVVCRACDSDSNCWDSDPAMLTIIINGTSPETDSGEKDNTARIVVPSVLAPVAVVLAVVLVCYFLWRRKRNKKLC